jgi:hypothetical protein
MPESTAPRSVRYNTIIATDEHGREQVIHPLTSVGMYEAVHNADHGSSLGVVCVPISHIVFTPKPGSELSIIVQTELNYLTRWIRPHIPEYTSSGRIGILAFNLPPIEMQHLQKAYQSMKESLAEGDVIYVKLSVYKLKSKNKDYSSVPFFAPKSEDKRPYPLALSRPYFEFFRGAAVKNSGNVQSDGNTHVADVQTPKLRTLDDYCDDPKNKDAPRMLRTLDKF